MLGEIGLLTLAGLAAGFVNAVASGGTLISFSALVAIGLPPVVANLTSTVALLPAYLGATVAQREDLQGQQQRPGWLFLSAVAGGMTGAMLLLHVILLAVLSLVLGESLTRLNGWKQILALGINVAAAAFFVVSGEVVWPIALGMAIASVVGGLLGGKFARAVKPHGGGFSCPTGHHLLATVVTD
ncbi:TSUP family transporter [Thermosynechococcus sp.]|uniref:TSUP family transporter n=1 Tax=Thermosynechococcus sp. TaxID=2814275 RepID=UPI00391B6755